MQFCLHGLSPVLDTLLNVAQTSAQRVGSGAAEKVCGLEQDPAPNLGKPNPIQPDLGVS